MTIPSRRDALKMLAGGVLSKVSAASGKPLNIVFILIDDMGWTDLAVYGSKLYETPNIDRLAAQGMRFTDAYAAAPLCSPTRASVLTGKYPARLHLTMALPGTLRPQPYHRMSGPAMPPGLPLEEMTIAKALKSVGYATAAIGKWHLGKAGYYPENHGFDVRYGTTDFGMATSQFYPRWKEGGRAIPVEGSPGEYLGDRLTSEALRFIEDNKSRPFFLYLSHYAVHTPVEAPPTLVNKYKAKVDPKSPQHHPVYAAMVESVDESVGRVMRKLDETGIADRTVIIFTSDNGGVVNVQRYTPDPLEPTSNIPLRDGKATLFEGGIRVPLIIKWHAVTKPNSVSNTPVISADFFPTITDMVGVRPYAAAIDGLSLVPILKGDRKLRRNALFWHYPHNDYWAMSAVRQGDYKLIEYLEDGRVELYNLRDDIGETKNLAGKLPSKATELRSRLHGWRKSVDAQEMIPNPGYDPSVPLPPRRE